MKLIDTWDLVRIIQHVGLRRFNERVLSALERDFAAWRTMRLSPRHATHYPNGVIELMPCGNDEYYAFKYVNGHPGNPANDKLSVVAIGMLAEVNSGYPLLISEMTLLTAIRTAVTAALGAKFLARGDSTRLALVGTGAQAEFQVHALKCVLPIDGVTYYDCDQGAMEKFSAHMRREDEIELIPTACIADAIKEADIIVTATAAKRQVRLFGIESIRPGTHIHAMGGDCPGKTEFGRDLLEQAKVVVEFLEQSSVEGEIQNAPDVAVHAELWEIVSGSKPGRENAREITLFDAVGIAVEDFSVLRVVYELAGELKIGREAELIPSLDNPKDLFALLDCSNREPSKLAINSNVR